MAEVAQPVTLNTKGLELSESLLLSLVMLLLSCVLNLNGSGMVGALAAAFGTCKTSHATTSPARRMCGRQQTIGS